MNEYVSRVPSRLKSATPDPRVPSADEILAAATSEGSWEVPVEMAVFCTSSAFKAVILARYPGGNAPRRKAKVFARGDRFFAIIEFPNTPDLLIPLDCHTLENRP